MWRLLYFLCLALGGAVPAVTAVAAVETVPFDYAEGMLWIKVEVPQCERPLNFLFDTGAEISVIDAGAAARLGLAGGHKIHVQGVDAATTGRWPVALHAQAGQVGLPAHYLSLDLSRLAHSCERPLDGLLGADFIRGQVVQIDFSAHQIRLLPRSIPPAGAVVLPLKLSEHCFCVPARINGVRDQWLRIDTGCATALQWAPRGRVETTTARPAIGLARLAIPQSQTTVALGAEVFAQVPTGIHPHAIFPGEAGLLGNGLLDRFQAITIDARAHRLVLLPRQPGV